MRTIQIYRTQSDVGTKGTSQCTDFVGDPRSRRGRKAPSIIVPRTQVKAQWKQSHVFPTTTPPVPPAA
jgi:hypothetical protein